jgi:hypothetical protein
MHAACRSGQGVNRNAACLMLGLLLAANGRWHSMPVPEISMPDLWCKACCKAALSDVVRLLNLCAMERKAAPKPDCSVQLPASADPADPSAPLAALWLLHHTADSSESHTA